MAAENESHHLDESSDEVNKKHLPYANVFALARELKEKVLMLPEYVWYSVKAL
ncbi:hypothetical protein [Pontibacter ramchanderi]|nr:hypothetical protein [Pontibacter ramchanderi]